MAELIQIWTIAAITKIVFFLLTAIIPALTYRAYRFFKDMRFMKFSAGFSLISVSFLVQAIGNIYATILFKQGSEIAFTALLAFQHIGEMALIMGLLAIIAAYLDVKDWWHLWLLIIVGLFAATLSVFNTFLYLLLVSVLLVYIITRLWLAYTKKRMMPIILNIVGFSLILIADLVKLILVGGALIGGPFTIPFDALLFSVIIQFSGYLAIILAYVMVLQTWRRKGARSK